MSNIGVENTETATERVVHEPVISVINIAAFIEIFYLQAISFDLEYKELIAWFRPKKAVAGGVFSVSGRIIDDLFEVVYTEEERSVTVKIQKGGPLISYTGDSFQDNGQDLTGSVCFAVKMDPARFPKWAKYRNGILIFRLKDGRKYQFQCAK